ncbi:putative inactive receptor kinase [Forsythia ovata]|uniref:Inactive receptor kinase n=1 Tax=Forsythia ovata TaxID=205694 RepID=A0ABD1WLP6_9LAMI
MKVMRKAFISPNFLCKLNYLAFDLQDLLSAYGEILARGTLGFTYSAQLKNGPTMVVKALTEVSVTIVEFEKQMKFLGSIKHDNVVIPRGYHFSEDYKFILYNHYSRGSVSAMLHGYAAPEVTDSGKVSQASDVYSFGVLLLELLTGKSPTNYTGDCEYKVQNFFRWVHCMVSGGLDVAVFDAQIFRHLNVGELEQILEIGMSCVARIPEHRPKMSNVVKMMENVRELDEDFEFCLTPEPCSSDYEDSF